MTGAWREGEPPGRRRFVSGVQALETGGTLPFTLAYETWGSLNSSATNAILVEHALTGDSHAVGPAEEGHVSPGWWDGLIGPGKAIDTDAFFVVVPNVLGGCQGSTGPSSAHPDGKPWGSRFPAVTVRDQVAAETAVADALGIGRWAAVIGGSMGGMRALEWAVGEPERVAALLVLASTAQASADQIAWAAPQLHAIRSDPGWHGGDYHDVRSMPSPDAGLGVARRIAHATYRSEAELAQRFGHRHQDGEDPLRGGRFAVESYLDHHAAKLSRRFDAGSYVVLTESMNTHDVGRGRGGVANALGRITARTVAAGVDSDRLYPLYQSRAIADGVAGAEFAVIASPYGHDSFLIETEQIGRLVKLLLG
ncbi:homoserine O-acetyltransferase [Amycolatopsis sp. EV170708-02-1]|uniref:homoserine O-acetyltransferase MetX n=1 Tax=Amycolatopsis sp. EV170708-02-1 TaxID=2919322 RepID=UPI001F0BE2ED|nr:homoserine O-acetyltransferase [Amycolatopsis sp. EV170708-02-1]UMP06201.1 homoserine O-acetyltransferase [Amycolatopsis sp. EV170708-02-1]